MSKLMIIGTIVNAEGKILKGDQIIDGVQVQF